MALHSPVPAPRQQPPPVSIITSSILPADTSNGRWVNGFEFQPESSAAVTVADACASTDDTSTLEGPPGLVQWTPFLLRANDQASTFGFEAHDYVNRAMRRLDVGSAKALEAELWSGALAQAQGWPNRFLAASTTASAGWGFVNLNDTYAEAGSTPSLNKAFDLLEQYLADQGVGARGMIHCRVEALPHLLTIRRVGNYILTARDTVVVPGTGYPNTGPGGTAPATGKTWMFATGMTEVRLGPITTFPDPAQDGPDWLIKATSKAVNLITVRAERVGLVSWDGFCHAGIQCVLDS